MQPDQKVQDVLTDYETTIRDKRIKEALRPIKTGRSLLFLIGVLCLLPALVSISNSIINLNTFYSLVLSILFFTLFFFSRYYPYTSLLLGTIIYCIT
jgi:hypothetical protein